MSRANLLQTVKETLSKLEDELSRDKPEAGDVYRPINCRDERRFVIKDIDTGRICLVDERGYVHWDSENQWTLFNDIYEIIEHDALLNFSKREKINE